MNKLNAATALMNPEPGIATIKIVAGAASSSTYMPPVVPPRGPGWHDAIYGGLRFKLAPDLGHILAGHSLANMRPETEVVDTFLEFSSRYWLQSNVYYKVSSQPWPRIHGWVQESSGNSTTFTRVMDVTITGGTFQATEIAGPRVYWAGATFDEPPTPKEYVEQVSRPIQDRLITELGSLFDSARGQIFEYGEESAFADRLVGLLNSYGPKCLEALELLLFEGKGIPREAALEALAVVGTARTPSHSARVAFLVKFLSHPSAGMRDAAGLALLDAGDRSMAGAIRAAVEREANPQVRKNLLQVLSELEG